MATDQETLFAKPVPELMRIMGIKQNIFDSTIALIDSIARCALRSYVEAAVKSVGAKTELRDRHLRTAVKALFDGELSKHAISETTKVITKVSGPMKKGATPSEIQATARIHYDITRSGALLARMVPDNLKIDGSVAAGMTAAMEYLTAELVELAASAETQDTSNPSAGIISPIHLVRALARDNELHLTVKNTIEEPTAQLATMIAELNSIMYEEAPMHQVLDRQLADGQSWLDSFCTEAHVTAVKSLLSADSPLTWSEVGEGSYDISSIKRSKTGPFITFV
eukprot:TRINITY_DN12995_c0_g1_i1.p1 TRINITY_DN12995_c0_g1~~TRINITY_DN12995_c0_g1_i1.p1  ORF type:complete len:293 (+),score=45.19 TRINITY_DN12995_c0_g1_i1:34-879(+)